MRGAALPGFWLAAALSAAAFCALARDAIAQDQRLQPVVANEDREIELAPPGDGVGQDSTTLSPEERLRRGKAFVDNINRASDSLARQLQIAKDDRDVVRVLCLNDKLNQVNVAQRSAQDRLGVLQTAAQRADADRTRHEYTVLEVLADRVRVLLNESSQCVGEETGFIGEAEVTVSIDPSLPDADTSFGADPFAVPPSPSISSGVE